MCSIKKILICGELGPDLHGRSLCFCRYNFFSICHSLVFIKALGSERPQASQRAARALLERAGNKAIHLFIYFADWLIYS